MRLGWEKYAVFLRLNIQTLTLPIKVLAAEPVQLPGRDC